MVQTPLNRQFQTKFEKLACRIDNLKPVIDNFGNEDNFTETEIKNKNSLSINNIEGFNIFKKVVEDFFENVDNFTKTEIKNKNQDSEEKDKKSETKEKKKKTETKEKDKKTET